MFKALTPIIGIIVAIGLFFTYIRPTFDEIKVIQGETAEYAEATTRASELQQRVNELKQQESSISPASLKRLEALLPDHIDEVSVLIDVDSLAAKNHLVLGDIDVTKKEKTEGSVDTSGQEIDPLTGQAIIQTPEQLLKSQYDNLDISFSVSGTYNDFRVFLLDLERSLVLMDVTKIKFVKSEGDVVPYTMTIRLYSLKPPAV